MRYEEFLFAQLFMHHVENNETEYQQLEYDLIFPEVLKHRALFLESHFNVRFKSEYDCIVDYLTCNLQPPIPVRIETKVHTTCVTSNPINHEQSKNS